MSAQSLALQVPKHALVKVMEDLRLGRSEDLSGSCDGHPSLIYTVVDARSNPCLGTIACGTGRKLGKQNEKVWTPTSQVPHDRAVLLLLIRM